MGENNITVLFEDEIVPINKMLETIISSFIVMGKEVRCSGCLFTGKTEFDKESVIKDYLIKHRYACNDSILCYDCKKEENVLYELESAIESKRGQIKFAIIKNCETLLFDTNLRHTIAAILDRLAFQGGDPYVILICDKSIPKCYIPKKEYPYVPGIISSWMIKTPNVNYETFLSDGDCNTMSKLLYRINFYDFTTGLSMP